MTLTRPARRRTLVSLVPMVDVMMIMLVFFMVTSTYLDLDMIALSDGADGGSPTAASGEADTLLIRLGPDGQPRYRGAILAPADFPTLVRDHLASNPALEVLILPSSRASTQALVSVMEDLTLSGAETIRLVRLQGEQ